jgi:hypothetical protein
MSAFEALAQIGGRAGVRDASGDRRGAPCGRAAPEKTLVDLRNFWVNGVNSGINGVNGRTGGVNGRAHRVSGRRSSARCSSDSDLVRGCDEASLCFRIQTLAGAGRQAGHCVAGCRGCCKSGGTHV